MWHKKKHAWVYGFSNNEALQMGRRAPSPKKILWTAGHAHTEGRGTHQPPTNVNQLVKDLRVRALKL